MAILPFGLTPRELQVVTLLCDGLTNAEIGRELCIESDTVTRHLSTVFDKTGLSNRVGVAMLAVRSGLVKLPTPERADLLEKIEESFQRIERHIARSRMLVGQLVIKEKS